MSVSALPAIGDVAARIAAIQARFPVPAAAPAAVRPAAAPAQAPADFATALAGAEAKVVAAPAAPASTTTWAPTPLSPGPATVARPAAPATSSVWGPRAAGASTALVERGEAIVEGAKRYLGVPYLWGGTTPAGLDCSGLVQRVYREVAGVELPRVSRDQARAGTAVPSLAEARPGDLVAFGSPVDHIGIYIGDGMMIAAPQTGDVVRVKAITRPVVAIRRVLP